MTPDERRAYCREYIKQYRREGYGRLADARYRDKARERLREYAREYKKRRKARRDGVLPE